MRFTRWVLPFACLLWPVLSAGAQESASGGKAAGPAGTAAGAAEAAPATEVESLRREVEELKAQLRLLQDQMRALAAGAAAQVAGGPATPPVAAPVVTPEAPPAPEPVAAPAAGPPPTRSQGLLNPAISAVMQLIGNTSLTRQEAQDGFDLSEAELALQSAVDPFAKVDLFLSFPAGESPEVEEGFLTSLSLPGSLQVRGGRFKSSFGKWNQLHTHAFFTVERPDALVNFLGDESLTDDGLGLSVLVPNPWDQYIDLIVEAGTPRPGPAFNSDGHQMAYLARLNWFVNTGANSTVELGASGVRGTTGPPEELFDQLAACGASCVGLQPGDEFASAVQGLDVTWKWKPLQLNVYKSFLWQTEYLHSRRETDVLTVPAAPAAPALRPEAVSSGGGYSYVEWQLAKRWRVGARYDLSGFPDSATARTQAESAVIRFQPSEFQELRFQFKHTGRNAEAAARFDGDADDNQIFFEWIPVIGAHGAHKY
jgi:hypothetical protein